MSRRCRRSSRGRQGRPSVVIPGRNEVANPESRVCGQRHLALAEPCGFGHPKPHAHPPARLRRPRTCPRLEDRGLAAGDKTLVRARQCGDRARGRMRRARCRRPCGRDRVLQGEQGRARGGRPGDAARRRDRRRSHQGRHQGVRAGQAGRAARRLQGIHQGPLQRVQHSDRRLSAASTMRPTHLPTCARRARRSWSRPTALPPARAWWWR